MSEEHPHLPFLKLIHTEPQLSQRELAEKLGFSLGKANYCMRALIAKGLVKLENFQHSSNKRKYTYLLTPAGVEERTRTLPCPANIFGRDTPNSRGCRVRLGTRFDDSRK